MSATMFRLSATRSIPRSLHHVPARSTLNQCLKASFRSSARPKPSATLAVALHQTAAKSLVRYQSTSNSATKWGLNKDAESAWSKEKLVAHPELVSTGSSVHPALQGEVGVDDAEREVEMSAGIKNDFNTIKDTFSLQGVPKEAMYVGLAGVVPYLVTSLSTVYLSFDIQYAAHHGTGILLDGATAETLLHILEPIQLGYGASIISFLGAIHWGLEWAGFGGYQGYKRYAIGIVATAVAWPTVLLSAEIGLITQFLAFTFLYYTDARAANRGWAPQWYGIYRFILTFIVGASIVASLVGRGQIADLVSRPPGPADRMRALRDSQLDQLEREDAEFKARAEAAAAGSDGDEEEEEEEDGDDE